MSGAAKVNFDVTNLTAIASVIPTGIAFVQGQSKRGPFNDPSEIINGWPRFVELHGGLMEYNDTPLLVKRFLDKGGKLRFNRVGSTGVNDGSIASTGFTTTLSFQTSYDAGDEIKLVQGSNTSTTEFTNYVDLYNNIEAFLKSISSIKYFRRVKVSNSPDQFIVYSDTDINLVGTNMTVTELGTGFYNDAGTKKLFGFQGKYQGDDYNNIIAEISSPSNRKPGYFNITITHRTEPTLNESYTNLQLNTSKTFLGDIANKSKLVDPVYEDGILLTDIVKLTGSVLLVGGKNPVPQISDYVGDSSLENGLHSFDNYDDSYYIVTMDDVDIINQTIAYIEGRQDITTINHLSANDKQTIIEEYETLLINSKYSYTVGAGGGIKIIDPLTNTEKIIKETADVLALAVNSDTKYGPWYSFAGSNRGIITNTLGVKTNFGNQARSKDLDELAEENINMVIVRDNSVKLWGNFSGQQLRNQERYFNVVKLVIFLKKALRPLLEPFLEEPNDIPTWKSIYYTIEPLMTSLKNRRAIYTWDWAGDQFAKSMNDLVVNNTTDVAQGKYKVILTISAITSLQEINVGIYLTEAGLQFEIINQQNQ